MEIFIKTIFSSISRLFFAYSKFIVMVTMLSGLSSTVAHSSEGLYLECDGKYFRITGTYLESNYNIRTKKFKNKQEVSSYVVNYIWLQYGSKINRNNGEYISRSGKKICILKKISFLNLPVLNQEGKLF